jgi:hypothetical protein
MFAMLRDAWAEWRFEPERFIDAGDQVVVFVRVLAKGRRAECRSSCQTGTS